MTEECEYCDEEFDSEKDRLEHELEEHEDELSSHAKSDRKSELNKLKEEKKTKKNNRKKKMKFAAAGVFLIGIVAGAGFMAVQNADVLNGIQERNESAGIGTPVHWHADYNINVCGERRILQGGPLIAHTHGQPTFHMEGVRENREEATLEWVVEELSQEEFNSTHVLGQSTCNGEPADLTVEVNGQEQGHPYDYILRDGDVVNIRLQN